MLDIRFKKYLIDAYPEAYSHMQIDTLEDYMKSKDMIHPIHRCHKSDRIRMRKHKEGVYKYIRMYEIAGNNIQAQIIRRFVYGMNRDIKIELQAASFRMRRVSKQRQ
jgi:hypothetical protein